MKPLPKNLNLTETAKEATKKAISMSPNKCDTKQFGAVGTAILSSHGNIYTGVSIICDCGIGFCAEHSAVAEMIKNGESEIKEIVSTMPDGTILPPCGRCRELIYQINNKNLNTEVILDNNKKMKMKDLLPENWQDKVNMN